MGGARAELGVVALVKGRCRAVVFFLVPFLFVSSDSYASTPFFEPDTL